MAYIPTLSKILFRHCPCFEWMGVLFVNVAKCQLLEFGRRAKLAKAASFQPLSFSTILNFSLGFSTILSCSNFFVLQSAAVTWVSIQLKPPPDSYRDEALETPQPVAQHSQRRPQVGFLTSKCAYTTTRPFHINVALPRHKKGCEGCLDWIGLLAGGGKCGGCKVHTVGGGKVCCGEIGEMSGFGIGPLIPDPPSAT